MPPSTTDRRERDVPGRILDRLATLAGGRYTASYVGRGDWEVRTVEGDVGRGRDQRAALEELIAVLSDPVAGVAHQ